MKDTVQIPCPCEDDAGQSCGLDTEGERLTIIREPAHKVTRTIQLQITETFSDLELATATLAARERECSAHKVLAERLRANAARLLRNGGLEVHNA